MENKSFSGNNSILTEQSTSDYSLVTKLRRLKIHEELILKNIHKFGQLDDDYFSGLRYDREIQFNKFKDSMKKNYLDLRYLFNDMKTSTLNDENLDDLNISDLKRDISSFEEKLKSCYKNLQSELTHLKIEEQTLIKEIDEDVPEKLLKTQDFHPKFFTKVVPSPVKLLINSPLKCRETQNLQDFLDSSSNRFGGWIEYNHNIFVSLWKKHCDQLNESINEGDVKDFELPQLFIDDVLKKTTGITSAMVMSHAKWYITFLGLKHKQRCALNKWKANKIKLRHVNKENDHKTQEKNSICKKNRKLCQFADNQRNSKDIKKINNLVYGELEELGFITSLDLYKEVKNDVEKDNEKHLDGSEPLFQVNVSTEEVWKRIGKPTKQWTNRICDKASSNVSTSFTNLESIAKLHVPSWRIGLKNC